MPNQAHSGWQGVPWHRCDRCGLEFPVAKLRRQEGLILDERCIDNEQVRLRPAIIKARISEPQAEPELAEILKNTDDNLVDEFL